MKSLIGKVEFRRTLARYLVAIAAVTAAFALRFALSPVIGRGSVFVLFFTATLATGLLAGTGPGLLALLISLTLAPYFFVVRAGQSAFQAAFQALLFAIDGGCILYLTFLVNRRRRSLEDANEQLRRLGEEANRAEARARAVIEFAPDAFFLADREARFTDVNQAACGLLGYERNEIIGKTMMDITAPEEVERLEATWGNLLAWGTPNKQEWTLKRKNGTLVPVEISSNVRFDGRWQAFARDVTERKRVDDLRQLFVSLLDNSVDFISVADPTGRPIYLNTAGRRMVGLAPEFPIEHTRIEEYYPPDLRSFASDVILKTMMEGGVWSGDTFFQHFQTHERIPVSDTHFAIRDASGKRIIGYGTVTRDMSEARRAADERERLLAGEQHDRRELERINGELRESEERFRLTVDEAPIGMALVALDGHFVRVNRVLCELTGYPPDELVKLTYQDITHPDDLDVDVSLGRQLARGEVQRFQVEKRYIRKDRSIVDVLLSVSLLRGSGGEPLYNIAQMQDISERKRAEAALRLSEAKFSGIVSIAADAIISVDRDQRITVFNDGAESIFGYVKDEVMGTSLERLIPERFRARHREHFAQFAAGEETARRMALRLAVFGLRKNGEEFPAEASIAKVEVGDATFFSVVLRDVTDRKNAEAALQRAVAARDDLLRVVAHDLRNPLSTIILQASSMERIGPEPERRNPQARDIIVRAAARMNRLIQDLLDVALVEAGQFKVEPTRLSAEKLARDALETQASLAAEANLEVELDVADDVGQISADRNRLLQVFENLIGNAIRYTKAGGRITLGARSDDGNVEFSVSDTGVGIPPDGLPHVFDRFWQATMQDRRSGAGLGLSITKGIVEAHGGRIWVESQVGRGTTFTFTIPKAPAGESPS